MKVPSSNHWMTREFAASVIFTMTFFFLAALGLLLLWFSLVALFL